MTDKPLISRRGLLGAAASVTAAEVLAVALTSRAGAQTAPASPSTATPKTASPVSSPQPIPQTPRELVAELVASGAVPGAVVLIAQNGKVTTLDAFGNAALRPTPRPMRRDTVFDLASLTKVVAATPAVAKLVEQGKVDLDAPVATYLPAFKKASETRQKASVRHVMTHTAGVPAGGAYAGRTVPLAQVVEEIVNSREMGAPGEKFIYSDYSAVLMQAIAETVSGQTLDVFCREQIWGPLGMNDTAYNPQARGSDFRDRCASTSGGDDTPENRGVVHDPTARAMGGVSGNAGLFSTAQDLARYGQMWLSGGEYRGEFGGRTVRIFSPDTVRRFTAPQAYTDGERALGWDRDSGYSVRGLLPVGSFGHTGFTGTSFWLDPRTGTQVILLTNSVHNAPVRRDVIPFRRRLATAVASTTPALVGDPKRGVLPRPGNVRTGLDTLAAANFELLRGRNVGIVCNHTAVDRREQHLVDLANDSGRFKIVALYGPEHSIRGDVDASADDSKDQKTGLPVFSLYNLTLPREQRYRPTPEQLAGVDTLVFDIQDIGARFYTYIATLGYCMEACAKQNIRMVVLDRPNPLGGFYYDGPLLEPTRQGQFTAYHRIPVAHGLTVGELAAMYNEERKIGAQLEIVPVSGWHRGLRHDQTGLPWLNPSPNIRNVREAILYPGVGMLEVLPVSVGRGTDTPFEIVGAPFIDNLALADDLNGRNLPGVGFTPVRFTPVSSVHKGKLCHGVQVSLWNRDTCRPVEVGIHMADALARLHPEQFGLDVLARMGNMVGTTADPQKIAGRQSPEQIIKAWKGDLDSWKTRRAKFLRYA